MENWNVQNEAIKFETILNWVLLEIGKKKNCQRIEFWVTWNFLRSKIWAF